MQFTFMRCSLSGVVARWEEVCFFVWQGASILLLEVVGIDKLEQVF